MEELPRHAYNMFCELRILNTDQEALFSFDTYRPPHRLSHVLMLVV